MARPCHSSLLCSFHLQLLRTSTSYCEMTGMMLRFLANSVSLHGIVSFQALDQNATWLSNCCKSHCVSSECLVSTKPINSSFSDRIMFLIKHFLLPAPNLLTIHDPILIMHYSLLSSVLL
uniref:Uncharacterized protein n=1 Tax=Opuntia streptacantha TaxID=393608 RepID=A0A7C9CN82_OPUST